MIRTFAPASSRCVAKLCLRALTVACFRSLAYRLAFWAAFCTAVMLIGRFGALPGNSQTLGRTTL